MSIKSLMYDPTKVVAIALDPDTTTERRREAARLMCQPSNRSRCGYRTIKQLNNHPRAHRVWVSETHWKAYLADVDVATTANHIQIAFDALWATRSQRYPK
mgnify:CR=1 FL=1